MDWGVGPRYLVLVIGGSGMDESQFRDMFS